MTAHGLQVKAEKEIKPEEDIDSEVFAALLSLFEDFIHGLREDMTLDELLEELAYLRAKLGMEAALKGFDMDFDDAVKLLESDPASLSDEQKKRRDILFAAFDNIIDFAVAEEYTMIDKMAEDVSDIDSDEEFDDDEIEELMLIFQQYNSNYRVTEDGDIEHAMHVALGFFLIEDSVVLTYRTQLDDRVRPWHLQYEGFSAPKAVFPEWLIPPIEHGCRCFLEEVSSADVGVMDAVYTIPTMPPQFNRTFKESVAKGGRIFSDEHPYFTIKEEDADRLNDIAIKIKERYHLNG